MFGETRTWIEGRAERFYLVVSAGVPTVERRRARRARVEQHVDDGDVVRVGLAAPGVETITRATSSARIRSWGAIKALYR